ncbi:Calcium-dependent protease precursor [Richelia intracellularis HH01]|uniref:Calcium-dependent protease n=1 Tax=Richelia intracellularis HH01 TaxID=1165094 RepID=M1WYJ8_9NOST|nr:S8 family serine peptidase [Richelia intracellularis]CCH66912.1 Calcium-dependent protease precursor [Richelia intracellularis HH01]
MGIILQRGGEEFCLEKLGNYFTLRFRVPLSSQDLSNLTWGIWQCHIPQVRLDLFQVLPENLEKSMSLARLNKNVAFASHVYQFPNSPGTSIYLSDEITVQFASGVNETQINSLVAKLNLCDAQHVNFLPNTFSFRVSQQAPINPIKITNSIIIFPEVLVAEPNIIIRQETHHQRQDFLYSYQWYLNHNGGSELASLSHISVEKAWDMTRGNRSVVIAVVDDSFDLNHPDFQGTSKIVAPKDLKDNNFLPLPGDNRISHGNASAGIALAEDNGCGIIGVAPGCALMPIRTTGFIDDNSIESIFNWSVENGASIISCCWGASAVYFPLSLRQRAVIAYAAAEGRNGNGCVILFSAGNTNRPINGTVYECNWPKDMIQENTHWLNGFAVHPDVITVSASTSLNRKAAYSNWGENISICSPSNNAPPGMWFQEAGFVFTQPAIINDLPGRGMFDTKQLEEAGYSPGDFTSNFGGTSSATSIVAGVVALILSINPDLTTSQIRTILEQTADKIVDTNPDSQLGMCGGTYDENGHSLWFGHGKVNAGRAVKLASQMRIIPNSMSKHIVGMNNHPIKIPDYDPQGITSGIKISESILVKDIRVTIDIYHQFLGDLEIYLITPNNQRVLLQNRTLGCRTNFKTICTLISHPKLKQVLHLQSQGDWYLWVIDFSPRDMGTINGWQLSLGG